MPQRITQRDVARAARLHFSTVSLALSKSSKVNTRTREQVMQVARELGYERDPMLAALASYRKGRETPAYQGEFAWIVQSPPDSSWRQCPENLAYLDGAGTVARNFGYRVCPFDLKDYPRGVERLPAILRNRGIRGAFLCPATPEDPMLNCDLGSIPGVTLGFALRHTSLHAVAVNRYGTILDVIEQLSARGHRHIGFAVPRSLNDRLNGIYLAAFLLYQTTLPAADRLSPYLEDEPDEHSLHAWLEREQPTALLTAPGIIPQLIHKLDVPVPAKVSLALASLPEPDGFYAGIDECPAEVGRRAAELLVSRAETFADAHAGRQPELHLIRGVWRDGRSCTSLVSP
ncbi:hypothetical protein OPIT5_27735 [Opitutaceae bacterium TAV5]|nr:hypothetical protein OPIT5_27735 [Opitutaceae bacterium TAV5]